ncbi:DUF7935 family protein [Planktosalinus lacus]|uniref:Uncharacterized protein n=1 Tax=Planktosalinus lacus TaxID=1526573 RepID=A0A8J2VAG8_9FLAO|nr:hypothetical protein [Planktosalinus lacus]GGD91878.1 hypothetical protein GCM10011312_14610 [Planktosalinus lacus]
MEDFSLVLNYFAYLLPAIVVGIVAYYFFKGHTSNEEGRRRYLLQKESQKEMLPLRLQAYERFTLFLERVAPNKLLVRIAPHSEDVDAYEKLIIQNIEQEFEHNIAQQIYITSDCWNMINAAKNATIQIVRKTAMNEKVDSATKLRETIIQHFMDEISPSQKALLYLKQEVAELM